MRSPCLPLITGATTLLLSGCPFPIPPGYDSDSRQNLGEARPSFIRHGETTREDVIMAMGEPDAFSTDESRIVYGSAFRYGGGGIVMAAGGGMGGFASWRMRYRVLTIRFDKRGIVSESVFESRNCLIHAFALGNASAESTPCLDIKGGYRHEEDE